MHQQPDPSINGNGSHAGPLKKLKITEPLSGFPGFIFDHAESLEHLDLSGTGLSALPPNFGRLTKLKIAFFSNCRFSIFPRQLAACPKLEMVAFRGNDMRTIPEDSLPPRLRWLILTNNRIDALPTSIGKCSRLQKCMLSGNQLAELPDEMSSCRKLGLLRLSANRIKHVPAWLFRLPELAFLSIAGNPCCATALDEPDPTVSGLADVSLRDLDVQHVLGEGASGVISKGVWDGVDQPREVAIKLFKGDVTSDGTPLDEMRACITAGAHANLIDPLGRISDHPDQAGLVMELIPSSYTPLGQPPSLQSCTRDCFSPSTSLTTARALVLLRGIASAAEHLHTRGIAHGDLYAHNVLIDDRGHALLGDFGAASLYGRHAEMEGLEVLAFAHLLEDVWSLTRKPNFDEGELRVAAQLAALHRRCAVPLGPDRPSFSEISRLLAEMDHYP
ncbi:outer arm dynein light chain 1 [Xylariomycetidae sp. FL0641]|nr:outer arm dynein light chain 1 [Xylariomycetidae sp. FL0641]